MISFMYSLSMPAALANTPAPAYRVPVISSSPCSVPSSPNVPCSSGSTTSTWPRSHGTSPAAVTCKAPPRPAEGRGVISAPGTATASTEGSEADDSASRAGSAEVSTHRPSVAMPMGSTS